MKEKTEPYYIAFSHFLGIGPIRFRNLILHSRSVEEAYKAPKKKIVELIGSYVADKFVEFRERFDPLEKWEELKRKKITVLTQEDSCYPKQLKNIPDPPICLYVKGDEQLFSSKYIFAIVGTRKPTPYGFQIAKKFARELSEYGFIIVSGMAMGVDTVAHWGCLEAGGRTMAVLGCGVDIVYPAVNRGLYEQIIQCGVVVSEFPPGELVKPGMFIARNRLISGLSQGVLVIEGLKDSGALITARYAAEQGKDVFAPPAPLTSEMSEAPNFLLKQGAKLVTETNDILEEFNMKAINARQKKQKSVLSPDEIVIFEAVCEEPRAIDELVATTQLPINKVFEILSGLEIKGMIEKNSEGKYQIKL